MLWYVYKLELSVRKPSFLESSEVIYATVSQPNFSIPFRLSTPRSISFLVTEGKQLIVQAR